MRPQRDTRLVVASPSQQPHRSGVVPVLEWTDRIGRATGMKAALPSVGGRRSKNSLKTVANRRWRGECVGLCMIWMGGGLIC